MIEGKTVACLGGTFNRLHAGHQVLFKTAFEVADTVAVGVASDSLVRRLRRERAAEVRPFAQREADVRRLLEGFGAGRYQLAQLDDPYTPARREEFDAIIVSPDTVKTAEEINALRELRGFPPIKIVEVPWVTADDGRPVSSSRILAGEIDEQGRLLKPARAVPRTYAEMTPLPPEPLELAAPPAPRAEAPPEAPPTPEAASAAFPANAEPKRAPKKRAKPRPKARRAAPKRRATGKKAAARGAKGRSKARKGSRAAGPRSRR